ncbi:unnamed protein product, partial [Laminaria digitata]
DPHDAKWPGRSGQAHQLIDALRRNEGRPYPAYKDIEGSWVFG